MNVRVVDGLAAVVIAIGCHGLLGQLEGIPREGRIFPSFLLYGMILSCAILFLKSVFLPSENRRFSTWGATSPSRWLLVVSIFAGYVAGMFFLGFFLCTFLTAFGVTTLLTGKKSVKTLLGNLTFASALTVAFYVFFVMLMKVRFPDAWLI